MLKRSIGVILTEHQINELRRLGAVHERNFCSLVREGVDMVIEDLGGTVEPENAESRGRRDRRFVSDRRRAA